MKEEINLPALHVLVQKELQNRKVYQDADSFINGILGLKQHKNELQKEIDDLQKAKIDAVLEEKRAKEAAIEIAKKSEDLLGKARADAERLSDSIRVSAEKQAREHIAAARAKAENIISDYSEKISKLEQQNESLYAEQKSLRESVSNLSGELSQRQNALDALKAKFKILGD